MITLIQTEINFIKPRFNVAFTADQDRGEVEGYIFLDEGKWHARDNDGKVMSEDGHDNPVDAAAFCISNYGERCLAEWDRIIADETVAIAATPDTLPNIRRVRQRRLDGSIFQRDILRKRFA